MQEAHAWGISLEDVAPRRSQDHEGRGTDGDAVPNGRWLSQCVGVQQSRQGTSGRQDRQGTRAWWGQEGPRARARLGPRPNGTWGTGARHAICSLEIKLVSEQENEKRKNDARSEKKLG